MSSHDVDSLLKLAEGEYDDRIASVAEAMLICSGRCYGFDSEPDDSGRFIHALTALQADFAARGLEPEAIRGPAGVITDFNYIIQERMMGEALRLHRRGSDWAVMAVNMAYLVGILVAPKPDDKGSERVLPISVDEVDGLLKDGARKLMISPIFPNSWRWRSARLAWKTTVSLIGKHGSPYFTAETADTTWEVAIAAAIAETTSKRPRGARRTEPRLWNLFHPAQPDSLPPLLEECRLGADTPSQTIGTELGSEVPEEEDEADNIDIERGPRMHNGAPTRFFSLFTESMRRAADCGDEYARRVLQLVDTRDWWQPPKPQTTKPIAREKELAKRANQLLTLDRMGRTKLFALSLNHRCPSVDVEMDGAWKILRRLDADINGESWSEELGRYLPSNGTPLHRHAVGSDSSWRRGIQESDWYDFPAVRGCYVSAEHDWQGFLESESHRRWYTTLSRDVFVNVSPLLNEKVSVESVADLMGEIVDKLKIDPFATRAGAYVVTEWLIVRTLWQLTVLLIDRYGSDFTTAIEADRTWLDMSAALYKYSSKVDHPPKGTRKTEALRLGFNSHSSGTVENDLIDEAARRGDEYARRILERSESIEIWQKSRSKLK